MKIEFHTGFIKIYHKRFKGNKKIRSKFTEKTQVFQTNPKDSTLKDHELKGERAGMRAFSITGDIRVVYFINNNIAYFVDIGTHNQGY